MIIKTEYLPRISQILYSILLAIRHIFFEPSMLSNSLAYIFKFLHSKVNYLGYYYYSLIPHLLPPLPLNSAECFNNFE